MPDERQKEVCFCVHSASSLVYRCVTCFLAEFLGRLLNVRELGTEGIERIVLDWNQLDTVVKLDNIITFTNIVL